MIGAILRVDQGGLGNQSSEFVRHMKPDRILAIDFGSSGRGKSDPHRFKGDHVMHVLGTPGPDDCRRFLDGLDVVFTCEAFYQPIFVKIADVMGVSCIVQSNPEMHDPVDLAGARVVLPTEWESERVPHERILPVPIALDRFTPRLRKQAKVFYHVAAPAMLDRNGTAILLAALRHVTAEITVIIRGSLPRDARGARMIPPNVTLHEIPWTEEPYWRAYPDADVLLLPRRYGGLCLPMQETAALGMPVITTDLCPQCAYPQAELVPVSGFEWHPMKGGDFPVANVHPRNYAAAIDRLAGDPERVKDLSDAAVMWARRLGWHRLGSSYQEVLAAIPATPVRQ